MKKKLLCSLLILCQIVIAQTENKEIDSLKKLLKSVRENHLKQHLNIELSNAYLYISPDSTNHYLETSRPFLKNIPDSTLSDWHMTKFALFLNQKKFDSAKFHLDKTKPYKDLKYRYASKYFDNLGFYNYYRMDFENALNAWQEAYNLARKKENLDDQRNFLGKVAVCHQQLANFEEGVKTQLLALELAKHTKNIESEANSYNNLGMLFEKLEDYDKAKENLLKGLKIDSTLGNEESVIGSLMNLGIVHRKLGEKNKDTNSLLKAKDYYERGLMSSREIKYTKGVYGGVTNLAIVESSLGNDDKAIKYGFEAVQLNIDNREKVGELIARSNLAIALKNKNRLTEAEPQVLQAIEIAKETGYIQGEQDAYSVLSSIREKQGRYKEALDTYAMHIQIKDSITSEEIRNKVNELEVRFETAQKEAALLETRATLAEKELDIRKKNNLTYGLGGGILLLGLLGYLFYNQQRLKNRQQAKEFELEKALVKIETQNRLQEQRLRISRDLHDNIGSQLTFITSSLDNLKYGMKAENDTTKNKITEIGSFTKTTINELRDTIWAMNKESISFGDLEARLGNLLDQARTAAPKTNFTLDIDGTIEREKVLTSIEGMNLYRIIQEAVNNAIKHAEASEIGISLLSAGKAGLQNQNKLNVQVTDNGKGFDTEKATLSNGLNNMRKRAKDIGAQYSITSQKDKGTSLIIEIGMA